MNKLTRWITQKKLSYMLFFLLMNSIIFAQNSNVITGIVLDSNGDPIIGATIMDRENKSFGTITDFDGKFVLKINNVKQVKLIVSYIGKKPKEYLVKPGDNFKVILEDAIQNLNDVVVVGYGTAKRVDLTGAVTSVNEKVLKDIPVTDVFDALKGRLSGLNIVRSDGSPDADFAITLRGGGSITQDNTPLFIVDGFQVNDIKDIPPRDIVSIDVLKDASSTAIYGSQGANGVILITTRGGQIGPTTITLNSQLGLNKVYNLTPVLSPYEFVYYQRELDGSDNFFSNYGNWSDLDIYKSKQGSDWQNELFGNTAVQQTYNLSISGGDKTMKYNISYLHEDHDYILKTANYLNDNLSLKFNRDLSKKLHFDFTNRISVRNVSGPGITKGQMLNAAVKYAPVKTLPDLSADDIIEGSDDMISEEGLSTVSNPVLDINKTYSVKHYYRQTYNTGLTWDIKDYLKFRTQGSYMIDRNYMDVISLVGTKTATNNGGMPVATRDDDKGESWQMQNTLTFDKTYNKKHKLNVLIGHEITNYQNRQMYTSSKYFPVDFTADEILAQWSYSGSQTTSTTIDEPTRSLSYFGRVNYSFDNRYLITLTAREDGKNVFAPENRWGFFPGAAAAWRINEEEFLQSQKAWLSNLKLRLSYGSVGNARVYSTWRQDFSAETTANKMIYLNETQTNVLQPTTTMYNRDLTWETKISKNIGLDFGFFNEKLSGTIELYHDITKDLIMQVQIPSNSGFTTQFQNVGQTSNKGIELTLNGNIVTKNEFQLNANFNIAFNQNTVDQIDNKGGAFNNQSSGIGWDYGRNEFLVQVGKPLGLMYGYVSDGMYTFDDFTFDQTAKKWVLNEGVTDISSLMNSGNLYGPGHMKLKDLDGDGKITEANDRTIVGCAQPLFVGGFGLNSTWKDFDFSALFNFSYGGDLLNGSKVQYTTYMLSRKFQNLSTEMDLAHRFSTIDPSTGNNIYYGTTANPDLLREINQNATIWHPLTNRSVFSSWVIEDGSFLRLGNVTFGYTLPSALTRKALIQKFRLNVTGNNIFCLTKYTGQDPEVTMNTKNPMTQGVDFNAFPKARTLVFGANITF